MVPTCSFDLSKIPVTEQFFITNKRSGPEPVPYLEFLLYNITCTCNHLKRIIPACRLQVLLLRPFLFCKGCTQHPSGPITKIGCEGRGGVSITCPVGQVIHVIDGFYGRTVPDSQTCPYGRPHRNRQDCVSTSSVAQVTTAQHFRLAVFVKKKICACLVKSIIYPSAP